MENNKTGKYLKYAVGEIVLVVIGILIALQINNQNDQRKSEESIKKFYKSVILDLDEASKATKTQEEWFKIYQDLNFSIYEQSRGKIPMDSTLHFNALIWTHSFRPLLTENYESKFDKINHDKIQELFRDALWREQLTVEAIQEWNLMKTETLRPFLFRKNINNVEESYKADRYKFVTSKSVKLIDREKLMDQYQTLEFDQMLYELRHKTSWALECFKGLEASSGNLKSALQFYLDDDLQGLDAMESLHYYMNE